MQKEEIRSAINRLMCGNTAHSRRARYIKNAINSLRICFNIITTEEKHDLNCYVVSDAELSYQDGWNACLNYFKDMVKNP